MPVFQDAFISYGRADSKAFVIALKEQLQAKGIGQIWLDQDDIPAATDWQQRIDEAIARSHQFIYVISPSAMASKYCKLELTLARQYGKRIIPLLHGAGGDSNAWAIADPDGCTAVRQLNWIWCRDRLDDPEQFLETLSRTLGYCDENTGAAQAHVQTYVHQHTALLTQALTWERHHRQTRYLLVGTDRQTAETWLQTRFADGEPLPCTPSDLHCEFITESTKNANNLMTQVFLCHSDQDQAPAEQLRRSLLRQGITVWNYRTDIQTSQDYNSAIGQGIEEADNIVFLLSPHSAQSPYYQKELAQALALNKRVIPVLAAAVEPDQVPEGLSTLQHIDLTDNTQASDYLADESQLLKQLNTDAAYHTEHKTWLVQALKWQRQQQNPTLLLRGYNLRRAETWRAVARTHPHPPTDLHNQFIAESLHQPPESSLDVFISYSRVDSDFARRLNDALQTQGKRTWFDQESIATGSDFQQEIYRGIESSDVFVFVLSPESVTSPFCADEVEYAQGLNKRMVTVLHRAIDVADLHPVLAKLQWLDFREHDGDFQANFAGLLRTLDTDREHLETHTRLLVRSGEWDRRGRDESLLLRGQDLATAEIWLDTNVSLEPYPTGLQQEYVRASSARQDAQEAADRRLRWGALIGTIAAAAGFIVAVGSLRFSQDRISEAEARIAEANQRESDANQKVTAAGQKVAMAEKNAQQIERQAAETVKQATQALNAAELKRQQAETQLSRITRETQSRLQQSEEQVLEAQQRLTIATYQQTQAKAKLDLAEDTLSLAQEGSRLERAGNNLLRQANAISAPQKVNLLISAVAIGRQLEDLVKEWQLSLADYPATSPMLSLQSLLNNLSEEELLSARFAATPNSASNRFFADPEQAFTAVSFSHGISYLATADQGGRVRILSYLSGRVQEFSTNSGAISRLSLSPDGEYIATLGNDGVARIWNHRGVQVYSTETLQDSQLFTDFAFSYNGQQVAYKNNQGVIQVYGWSWKHPQITSRQPQGTITLETGRVGSMAFSPSSQEVAVSDLDGEIQLHTLTNKVINSFETYQNQIRSIAISPDGERIGTVDFDGNVRVWNWSGQQIHGFDTLPNERAVDVAFSPDGNQIAIAYSRFDVGKGTIGGQVRVYDSLNLVMLLEKSCHYLMRFQREYPSINDLCSTQVK
jgi:hypothetical protein